jgi:hypothetical protein
MKTKRHSNNFQKRLLHLGITPFVIALLSSCSSSYEGVQLSSSPTLQTKACFAGECNTCGRVYGKVGYPEIANETEANQSFTYYFDENDKLRNEILMFFTGFYYGYYNMKIPEEWSLIGVNNEKIRRPSGAFVNNYFALRGETSITLPQDENETGSFFRAYIENQPFRLAATVEGAFQIKMIDSEGNKTIVASQATPEGPGARFVCLPGTHVLTGTNAINLELDWILATGDPMASNKFSTFALSFTPAAAPNESICGQKVWDPEDTRRPAGSGILGEVVQAAGYIQVPVELHQPTIFTRQRDPSNFRICATNE